MYMYGVGGEEWGRDRESFRRGIPPGDSGREEEAKVLRPVCAGSCGRWESRTLLGPHRPQ